jgi:hypothetical protein
LTIADIQGPHIRTGVPAAEAQGEDQSSTTISQQIPIDAEYHWQPPRSGQEKTSPDPAELVFIIEFRARFVRIA